MLKKMKEVWTSPNRTITITPREAVLGCIACGCAAAACTLAGMVAGMLISPRKNLTIGSYNGSNNTGNSGTFAASAEIPEEAPAEAEPESQT